MSHATPPLLPGLLLRLALEPGIAELVLGDLQEEFGERVAYEGRRRARRWYWKQALTSSAGGHRPLPGSPRPRRLPKRKGASLVDSLAHDLRFTLRSFAKDPGFVAVAAVTLALGIGATTGVFSLANWIMLRPVPGVAGQERLASVSLGILEGNSLQVASLSYPNLRDLAGRLTQIDGLAGIQGGTINASAGGERAIDLRIKFVTASYADVLGLQPQLGRWFSEAEDDPAAPQYVAVISDATWKSMYASDPGVIGRDLRVNGRPFQIVGVAAEGFEGAYLSGGVGAWLPGSSYPWANHYEDTMDFGQRGRYGYYQFVARLAEGAAWEQAQVELTATAFWLAERYPEDNDQFAPADGSPAVEFHLYPGIGTEPLARRPVKATLGLMLGVVALVLLIACANVANLLLVRGMRRAGELAVRKALGAGRWRLVRQQLTEGVLLWLIGGASGIGVALLLMRSRLFAGSRFGWSVVESVPLDTRVLGFTALLALLTGLAFSLLPAWVTARVDAARTLQSGSDASRGRKNRLRLTFGVGQLAASLTLLVGALLLARTLGNMVSVDPGIDPSNVTATFLYPTEIGYSVEEAVDYFDRLRPTLAAHPGAAGVALTSNVPFYGFKSYGRARSSDDSDGEYIQPLYMSVSESYFELLSIPLLKGRTFSPDEVGTGASVMVVNQTMASTLFGETEPLGRSIEVPVYQADPSYYEVIGVVADTHYRDLTEAPEPTYFLPGRAGRRGNAVVLLRTRPGANGQEILRSTIAELSPALAPRRVESLEQAVRDATAQSRMLARLLGLLAAVASVLAAVGLYGMVATATAQRSFELGVRMALGSSPGRILRLVLASTAAVTGLGLASGLLGAWALSRAVASRLYGVAPFDPTSWLGAVLLLVAVTFAAALVPARRASRLDPAVTLRAR